MHVAVNHLTTSRGTSLNGRRRILNRLAKARADISYFATPTWRAFPAVLSILRSRKDRVLFR
jgi:hypothetical protein